jgi:endonuclease YncB( thermonuclease family)
MPVYGPYPATLESWKDGDTCWLDVDLGFGLKLGLSCRCFGINAPELHDAGGAEAGAYAATLAPPGSQVSVLSHGWDKYGGRFLGEITLPDGSAFATMMTGAGHARPYFGRGPKP